MLVEFVLVEFVQAEDPLYKQKFTIFQLLMRMLLMNQYLTHNVAKVVPLGVGLFSSIFFSFFLLELKKLEGRSNMTLPDSALFLKIYIKRCLFNGKSC